MKSNLFYRLIIPCIALIFIFSCNKDDDNTDPNNDNDEDTIEEVSYVHVVSRVIQESGLEFPTSTSSNRQDEAERMLGFVWPAEDYVTVDESDPEIILVKIWLDAENHIIPTPEWQINHPDYCMDQGKYMRPAKQLLQFKIHNLGRDDIRTVQLNHIMVDTQVIEHSVMTGYYEADPDWIYYAMSEVWEEMLTQTTIKNAVDPCDDRIPLTLHFNSQITFDAVDTVIFEEIEVTISLQFDETTQSFKGISEFVWIEGYAWIRESDTYLPYPTVKCGEMEIVELITPILANNSMEDATMTFKVPQPSYEHSSILLIALAEFYHSTANADGTMQFTFDEWQALDDPEIVMASYTNNQRTVDDGLITEATIFEIVR